MYIFINHPLDSRSIARQVDRSCVGVLEYFAINGNVTRDSGRWRFV